MLVSHADREVGVWSPCQDTDRSALIIGGTAQSIHKKMRKPISPTDPAAEALHIVRDHASAHLERLKL